MKPTDTKDNRIDPAQGAVVALGMFDGVHIGHQALIRRAVSLAKSLGCVAAVDTFANHPATILGGNVRMLDAPEERLEALYQLGAEQVRMDRFTPELASMEPEAFVELLMQRWQLKAVVVGFNYSFGAGGLGSPETLARFGKKLGFSVEVLDPIMRSGAPVSSSRIRACLEEGDLEMANDMLGRPYTLSGTVIANKRIGRRIGFPTANIAPEENRALPKFGVYATEAVVNETTFRAVTNVGTNPTVLGDHLSIETHLIGFDGDVYGKQLRVAFLSYLRGERPFDSVEALREQIARDVDASLALETDQTGAASAST